MDSEINGKRVIGLVQEVKIFSSSGSSRSILARIDTGATKSSIDEAIASELGLGPVIKSKTVRSSHGRHQRSIIMVDIEIAGKRMKEEFTIADRKHMKFAVLIGQNVLKDFMIDPSQ